MTIYLNCCEACPSKESLRACLSETTDSSITVIYDTNEQTTYNRMFFSDENIVDRIIAYITTTQNSIEHSFASMEPTDEELETMLDNMYQQYLNETENKGEREDAILHHWCA